MYTFGGPNILSFRNHIFINTFGGAFFNKCYGFGGRKFEHALKHGSRNGLSIVTIGWFVDSVRKNGKCDHLIYLLPALV